MDARATDRSSARRTQPSTSRKALLVINSDSGGARLGEHAGIDSSLRSRLLERDTSLEVIAFKSANFRRRLDAALQADARRIFVAGGDGTVLALIEALGERRIPLGIIPLGTMNWTARDLGIPLDPAAAVDALIDAPVHRIDLASVNGRPFLCACMVGFGSLLARWRERERESPGWRLWPKILLRGLGLLQRYRHLHMTLIADGHAERLESRTLVVTNNLIEESIGPIPQRSRLDAGLLGIYAVRKATPGDLTRLGTRLMLGNWQSDDTVLTRAAVEARLGIARRRALTLMLDGERTRMKTPLHFSIRPSAVQMLRPEQGA